MKVMPTSLSPSPKLVAATALVICITLLVALHKGNFLTDATAEATANPEELFTRMATVFAHPAA